MELMLEIISRQKFTMGKGASHVFGEVGGYIGRDNECEWSIPDKTKQISRKHALISCDGKSFFLEDLSTNGIHDVMSKERLPRSTRVKIEHGASFYFGEYTVQARALHQPETYIAPVGSNEPSELIPDDAFLDLDPLVAMDQQEEFVAKRRLGMYDDLLGKSAPKPVLQEDHNAPPIDHLLSVSAIPEDWSGIGLPPEEEKATPVQPSTPARAGNPEKAVHTVFPANLDPEPEREVVRCGETDVFFRRLGFTEIPENPEERERIMKTAADLLLAAVDGMLLSLRNRADSKNDLRLPVTTMTLASNNPLKFSPTALAALEYLLAPAEEGQLPAPEAMVAGFSDLHSHHMGLLAGARAAVRAALSKVSPEQIESRMDADGHTRFNRAGRLWHTYIRQHRRIIDDSDGFAAFFLQDFARAYEVQVRTLFPLPHRTKGE